MAIKAGAGCGEIRFPAETFPTDGIIGVHDCPHVRVLVLDSKERVAIVAMELVNIPDDGIKLAQDIISAKTGTRKENIWVHATHAITTPHAPRDPDAEIGGKMPPPPPDKVDPDAPAKRKHFIWALTAAINEAADEAAASFQDAVLTIGTGKSNVNTNRDVETPFGWWVGLNPEGISNKTATVITAKTSDGKLIGTLISYGIKPCAIDNSDMDKGTRLVSSDVPGLACTLLEEKYGAPCMFVMSAAGDQVPREQAWYDVVNDDGTVGKIDIGVQEGLKIVERLGTEMAEDIARIIDGTKEVSDTEIRRGKTSITWETKGRAKMSPRRETEFKAEGTAEVGADIITIGDIALVAVKPEVNTQTELELKEASPYSHTLLMSMINGGMKYMPDKSAYERVTWESQSASLMPGAAEAWAENTVKALNEIKSGVQTPVVTAVGDARPDGERITKAIIEFNGEVPDVNAISVKNRTVINREVNGSTVTLTLSEDDEAAFVLPQPPAPKGPKPGEGPKPDEKPKKRAIPERHRMPVSVTVTLPDSVLELDSVKVIEPVIEDFVPGEFKRVLYNLYTPKNQEAGKKYPLVMFIPDASANGGDVRITLAQGIGATVWAEPDFQAEHPCYVLAVQIPKGVHLTNNDYTCSDELFDIKELLDKIIAENNIDTDRIYTTGQSQGCMASCELNLRYPGFFTASMLVSGHWDVEKLSKLTNSKFFMGLSEGGMREYPFMNSLTEKFREAGVKVSTVRLNFRDGWEINEKKVKDAEGDAQIVYVIFEAATAFPDDGVERPQIAHHNRGWELSYQLKTAREWIFSQHK